MPNAERRKTGLLTCNHCGNYAELDIVADYYRSTNPTDDNSEEYYYTRLEEGYRYELLLCLSCKEVTLWKYFDAEYLDPEEIKVETLYPLTRSKLLGLPYRIQHAYKISLKVRAIDTNAYAVLLGRILEMVCEDRQAEGKDLQKKLENLSAKGEIPNRLVTVAHSLRQLRNVGAHNSLIEPI